MILPNATLFPRTMLPLYIFEPRYRRMLEKSLETHRLFAVAMKRRDCSREIPCRVAGLGMVRVAVRHDDGTSHLVLQGVSRIELDKAVSYRPFRRHRYRLIQSDPGEKEDFVALINQVAELVRIRLNQGSDVSFEVLKELASGAGAGDDYDGFDDPVGDMIGLANPEQLVDLVSCTLLTIPEERQTMMEVIEIEPRLNFLIDFLSAEVARNG
jgi:ATP-dependent Lon protease